MVDLHEHVFQTKWPILSWLVAVYDHLQCFAQAGLLYGGVVDCRRIVCCICCDTPQCSASLHNNAYAIGSSLPMGI